MADPVTFEAVDAYIDSLFVPEDPVLESIAQRSRAAGLPDIAVSAGQAKLLYILARLTAPRAILEIGSLGGYSTVWLARALVPGGKITTLEIDPVNVRVTRQSLKDAGLGDQATVIEGPALTSLPELQDPFDLVFLDANKESYPAYLNHAVRLTRPGGLIVADNVVRRGEVLAPQNVDPQAIGAAAFNQALASHPQLEAIVLQQVGLKGHDGLAIARVRDEF